MQPHHPTMPALLLVDPFRSAQVAPSGPPNPTPGPSFKERSDGILRRCEERTMILSAEVGHGGES